MIARSNKKMTVNFLNTTASLSLYECHCFGHFGDCDFGYGINENPEALDHIHLQKEDYNEEYAKNPGAAL